jgi:HD-GYP domain-containing protein (c-di-GMP phosphodiesterase class II)
MAGDRAPPFRGLHGLVAKRLLIAWILLSLAVGGAITYLEMRRVDELALGLAVSASESLRAHITEFGEQHADSLKQALAPLLRQGYVHARVIDKSGKVIAEANTSDQAEWLTRLTRPEHVPETFVSGNHRISWLTSELIVQVSLPLLDQSASTIGNFYGVYQVEAATRQHALMELVRNVSITLLAILVTSLALYPVIIGLNKGVLQLSASLMRSNIELMEVLGSAIAKRDSDTDLHNYRVCLYSIRFAESLGLSEEELRTVITGAFLHDAGKIGISDNILLKPGKLTTEEFAAMKMHVRLGTEIVAKSAWLEGAREVIEFHHERFDGSGYMAGLKGESIPLAARLFAIVDVFDALTSHRPYKPALPLEQAMTILAGSRGSHFDPRLFDVFEKMSAALHAEIGELPETGLRMRLHDQVTKYFFEGQDSHRRA